MLHISQIEVSRTYAAGQTLVNTNTGMLFKEVGGLLGPKALVICSATSNEMYVVTAKKMTLKIWKGWWGCIRYCNPAREFGTYNQRAEGAVLYNLRCDNTISKESPKHCCNKA